MGSMKAIDTTLKKFCKKSLLLQFLMWLELLYCVADVDMIIMWI